MRMKARERDTERHDGTFKEGLFVPTADDLDAAAREHSEGAPNSRRPTGGSVEDDRLDEPVNASIPPGGTYA
jgi:hypothetical protein